MTGPLNMNGYPINNIAIGNSPSSVATLGQGTPIGAVTDYAGAFAPAGWMLCGGQAISRTTYAALFAIIGTTYGAGNGTTTFNLPDLRSRVVAGRDNMGGTSSGRLGLPAGFNGNANVLGTSGGVEMISLNASQNGSHLHPNTLSDDGHFHNSQAAAQVQLVDVGNQISVLRGSAQVPTDVRFSNVNITNAFSGEGAPHNNVQPTIIMSKIIRVSYDG